MRPNSYVIVSTPNAEPQIGIIQQIITPHRFVVTVGEVNITVTRQDIERLKPRQRRNYRNSQRGN